MTYHTKIYVPLGRDEWVALRDMAEGEYRNPRDQARVLLRQALGLSQKSEETGQVSQAKPVSSSTQSTIRQSVKQA